MKDKRNKYQTYFRCHFLIVFKITLQRDNRMAALLTKFRITYSDLTIIKDVNQAPQETTRKWFDELIRDFAGRDQLPSMTLIALTMR